MATEVTVHQWCDVHLADSDGVDRIGGRTIPITIDGKAVEIDLCDQHEIEFIKPLIDLLDAHAARVDKPKQTKGRGLAPGEHLPKEACLVCGDLCAIGASLRAHYVKNHNCTEADAKGTATMWCPQKKADGSEICWLGYSSIQGLGMHLMRSHHVSDDDKRAAIVAGATKKPPVSRRYKAPAK